MLFLQYKFNLLMLMFYNDFFLYTEEQPPKIMMPKWKMKHPSDIARLWINSDDRYVLSNLLPVK